MKEYTFKEYKEFTSPNWLKSAVYFIKNIENNKKYIGSSTQVGIRINDHVRELRKNEHTNSPMQEEFNAYGEDKFVFGVFTYEPDEVSLRNLELEYQLKHKVGEEAYGYSLRLDGFDEHIATDRLKEQQQKQNYETFRQRIVRIDCNNANILIYPTLKAARAEHKSAVSSVLAERTYFSKGGYTWLRFEDFCEIGSISDYIINLKKKSKDRSNRQCSKERIVLDLETGIFYKNVREAYDAKTFDFPLAGLYDRLAGKVKHNLSLVILGEKNSNTTKVIDKSTQQIYSSLKEAAKPLGISPDILKYRIKNNVFGFGDRFELS